MKVKEKFIDIENIFDGLNPDQCRALTDRLRAVIEREVAAFKQPAANMEPPAKLGGFPEWKPGDGRAPYVFDRMPAGHRAAWSCQWTAANPARPGGGLTVLPADWGFADPERMSPAQVAAELEDNIYDLLLAAQPFGGVGLEGQFTMSLGINVELPNGVTFLVHQLLENFRTNYSRTRAYINQWNPPQSQFGKQTRRPGWSKS